MKTIAMTLFASTLALLAGCSSGNSPAPEDVSGDTASSTETLRHGPRHDGPETDPCAAARCAEGTHCEVIDGSASCAPDDGETSPCAVVLCPLGSSCEVIDGEGVCAPATPVGPFCGGIAAIECPGSGSCVDAPGDGCDPEQGGADCGGVCECNVIALCVEGFVFDGSPEVCACVPDEPPVDACAAVRCRAGTECVVVDGRAECQPVAPPECAAVSCPVGNDCVVVDGVAQCQPSGPNPCAAVLCPVGSTCEVQGDEGVCTPASGPSCGGFAGIACNGLASCVDDPADDCEPENGGADCGGICQCNVRALCIRGLVFDASPEVCDCVPEPEANPCALVDCFPDHVCEVQGGEAVCVPVADDPCATTLILCAPGTACVARDGEAICEPIDCE